MSRDFMVALKHILVLIYIMEYIKQNVEVNEIIIILFK